MKAEDATARARAANAILGELLELDPGDWPAVLDARALDSELRREVEALLQAVRTPDQRLDPPRDPFALLPASARASIDPGALSGRRIGAWELHEEIGRGGMSVVYRARRLGADFEQVGAVKLLGLAALGTGGRARFDRERAMLARLRHPQIAGLVDGGAAEDGTPYLVMQLIEGERIDRWCESRHLDLQARLRLLASVCEAVAHAHRQLVLHRDLKPANILVTPAGLPVLLDFGIGSLIDSEQEATQTALRAMTPGYAAPEQEAGLPCTTATDVFALGRVLAALLKDRDPLPRDLRVLLETAQHPDPERRYPDAHALADDIRRFLASRPLRAMPDSAGYRLRRFLHRRRGPLAAAALLLVALMAGLAATLWQARRAEAEAARAVATRDFLVELMRGANAEHTGVRDPPMSHVLDLAARRLDSELALAPALRIDLDLLLGELDLSLGRTDAALQRLQKALELAEAVGDRAAQANAQLRLGVLANNSSRFDDALQHFESALRLAPTTSSEAASVTGSALPGLAHALHNLGRSDEALARLSATLADAGLRLAPEQRANLLAAAAGLPQDAERRLELLQEAMALTAQADASPYSRLALLSNLAGVRSVLGQHAEAVDTLREAVRLAERIYPNAHLRRVRTYNNFGAALRRAGQPLAAEAAFAQAEAMYRELGDDASPSFAALLNNRGSLLLDLGQAAAAVPLLDRAETLAREHFGPNDPRRLGVLALLLAALGESGDAAAAEETWQMAQTAIETAPARSAAGLWLARVEAAPALPDAAAALSRAESLLAELDAHAAAPLRLRLFAARGAVALMQGDRDAAQSGIDAALALAHAQGEPAWPRQWRLQLLAARLQIEHGDTEAARADWRAARDTLRAKAADAALPPAFAALAPNLDVTASPH